MSRRLAGGLRLLGTAAILGILIASADLGELVRIAGSAQPALLALAVLLLVVQAPVLAVRWAAVARALGAPLAFLPCLRITWAGLLWNQLLPASIGGDAVRGWGAVQVGIPMGLAVHSIVIDRVTGLSVLGWLVLAGLPWFWAVPPEPAFRLLLLALAGGAALMPAAALLARLTNWSRAHRIAADLGRSLRSPRTLAAVVCLGIVSHGLALAAGVCIGAAIGLHLPAGVWLVTVPAAFLASVAPISFAGWGVREGALVLMLGWVGVDAELALALSIMLGAALIVAALPGGLVRLRPGDRRPCPDAS